MASLLVSTFLSALLCCSSGLATDLGSLGMLSACVPLDLTTTTSNKTFDQSFSSSLNLPSGQTLDYTLTTSFTYGPGGVLSTTQQGAYNLDSTKYYSFDVKSESQNSTITLEYGPHFTGCKTATFNIDKGILSGTIDKRSIHPKSTTADTPGTLTFTDGKPGPHVSVSVDLTPSLIELHAQLINTGNSACLTSLLAFAPIPKSLLQSPLLASRGLDLNPEPAHHSHLPREDSCIPDCGTSCCNLLGACLDPLNGICCPLEGQEVINNVCCRPDQVISPEGVCCNAGDSVCQGRCCPGVCSPIRHGHSHCIPNDAQCAASGVGPACFVSSDCPRQGNDAVNCFENCCSYQSPIQ